MPDDKPLLLLVAIPVGHRAWLERALAKVWAGRLLAVDRVDGGDARLAVAMGPTVDDALAVVRAHPGPPAWLVVAEGARHARNRRGGLPAEVPWALGPEEVSDAKLLALAVRMVLEVVQRRTAEHRLHDALSRAELGSAAAGVAHELGNPLTGLLTNLDLARVALCEDDLDPAAIAALRSIVGDALEGARHLARVAGDLSRVSARAGRMSTVDVRAVIDTAVRLAGPVLAGIEVRRSAPRPAPARVDEGRLCQVLVNLLKNAAEALRGHRAPVIEIDVDVVDANSVPRPARDAVVVRITDNGPGVSEAVAARLFEPYATTRAGGTGLGLALCRRFLGEMSASIVLSRTSPAGTTFEVRLVGAAPAEEVRPTLVPDFEGGRFRVLVLDDHPLVRRSILRALSPPHDVRAVAAADEALALLEAEPFDVVLVDLDLGRTPGQPATTGIDFHTALRTRLPHRAPAVVFVSGDYGPEDLAYLEKHGLAWIRKPFGAEDLRHLVSELTANPRPRRARA